MGHTRDSLLCEPRDRLFKRANEEMFLAVFKGVVFVSAFGERSTRGRSRMAASERQAPRLAPSLEEGLLNLFAGDTVNFNPVLEEQRE